MISLKSKKQNSVDFSRCEAEFISLANQEALYIRAVMRNIKEIEPLNTHKYS